MEMTFVPLALLGAAILLLVIFFYYVPFLLWISAKVSGVNISPVSYTHLTLPTKLPV